MRAISCAEADRIRPTLRPLSGITNWVGGEQLDITLPPITATTWGLVDDTEVMREELDARGCRHWLFGAEQ